MWTTLEVIDTQQAIQRGVWRDVNISIYKHDRVKRIKHKLITDIIKIVTIVKLIIISINLKKKFIIYKKNCKQQNN